MIFAAIIAAAAATISALIAAGKDAEAAAVRQSIADKYHDLPLPVLDEVVARKLPPDAADRYMKSTQSTQAQGDVLKKYMDEVNSKGETADDRASYLRMRDEASGIANDANGAVQRDMDVRGMGGSGLSFALKNQGAQSAINAANRSGVMEASQARGRYMNALQGAGALSGQMRSQELDSMKSQDAINEFNARQQSDADARNNALRQQQFDNSMSKLSGESNALNGVANGYERSAGADRQTGAGIANAAITAGAAYDQNGNPQKYDANGKPIP